MRTGRPKKPLEIITADRDKLSMIARRPKSAQAMAMRARIVLSCGQGMSNSEVARKLHITGATVGKWRGRQFAAPGGVGVASLDVDGVRVAAIAVVNAIGDVVEADGRVLAGSSAPPDAAAFPSPAPFEEQSVANTTLVAIVTDARCDKAACHLVAQSGHDGIARALRPSHTRFDGDLAIAVATGAVEAHLDRVRLAAADVAADAIRNASR